MMHHLDAFPRLDEYHDGELPRELAGEMGLHVAGCAACQAALGARAVLARTLAEAARVEPSARFVAAVMDRVAAERGTPPFWARWLAPSTAAALAAAAVAVVFSLAGAGGSAGDSPVALDQESAPHVAALAGASAFSPDEVLVALEEPQ